MLVSCAENEETTKFELSKTEQELLDNTEKSWADFNTRLDNFFLESEELTLRWEKAILIDSLDIIVDAIIKKSPEFSSGALKISTSVKERYNNFGNIIAQIHKNIKSTVESMELFPNEKKDALAGELIGEKFTKRMNEHLEYIAQGHEYLNVFQTNFSDALAYDSSAVSSLKAMYKP
jgi:hypothetical protein